MSKVTRILHLSDLHFTSEADVAAWLEPLVADIRDQKGGLGFAQLDHIVVSGDLTQQAKEEEFDKAFDFLRKVCERFDVSRQHCVIVPGNHDLSWAELVYEWRESKDVPKDLDKSFIVPREGGAFVRQDDRYSTRFSNFERARRNFVGLHWPKEPAEQLKLLAPRGGFQVELFQKSGLLVVGLNSAWEIDEHFTDRASINPGALALALETARDKCALARPEGKPVDEADLLRIAVWHHPAAGNDKIRDDAFLELLQQAHFKLCLHGHVHEERTELIGYYHEQSRIHLAGTGSFGAVARQRPESTPNLYQVLEFDRERGKVTVNTRSRSRNTGKWEGWAKWRTRAPRVLRMYYKIDVFAGKPTKPTEASKPEIKRPVSDRALPKYKRWLWGGLSAAVVLGGLGFLTYINREPNKTVPPALVLKAYLAAVHSKDCRAAASLVSEESLQLQGLIRESIAETDCYTKALNSFKFTKNRDIWDLSEVLESQQVRNDLVAVSARVKGAVKLDMAEESKTKVFALRLEGGQWRVCWGDVIQLKKTSGSVDIKENVRIELLQQQVRAEETVFTFRVNNFRSECICWGRFVPSGYEAQTPGIATAKFGFPSGAQRVVWPRALAKTDAGQEAQFDVAVPTTPNDLPLSVEFSNWRRSCGKNQFTLDCDCMMPCPSTDSLSWSYNIPLGTGS